MSTKWILANRWFTGYANTKRGDLHRTTVPACTAVLNRLTQRANDVGLAAIYLDDLVRTTGYSQSSVQRALSQLLHDGHIWQAIRGQGNRSGEFKGDKYKSPSVYALRPMVQENGSIRPTEPELQEAWTKHTQSDAWQHRSLDQRQAIREAMQNAWAIGTLPLPRFRYSTPKKPADAYSKGTKRRAHLQAVPAIEELKQEDPACG
jgi:hypothetical protein